jgi:hypothetical protein
MSATVFSRHEQYSTAKSNPNSFADPLVLRHGGQALIE